jgi:hypothetical protein
VSNEWFIPPATIGDSKTAYEIRAIIARVGRPLTRPKKQFISMTPWTVREAPLLMQKKYTTTFKQTPPFIEPAFWALRMFDATNSYPVPNPINRYVLGSDYPDMKKNADGSLTIYLQADDPGGDKEANWLPAPRGPFLLILGTYAPGQTLIESLSDPKAYVPPAAVSVD